MLLDPGLFVDGRSSLKLCSRRSLVAALVFLTRPPISFRTGTLVGYNSGRMVLYSDAGNRLFLTA